MDALWDKEPKTVSKIISQAQRAVELSFSLGILDPFPPMGPFPMEDTFGMKAACILLLKSLDAGKYAATVQFSTMRKMRSAFTNAFHSSVVGLSGATVMAKDTKKLVATSCPTYGIWFDHFVRGCHKRMGGIVRPDRALSLLVLHDILHHLELEWQCCDPAERYSISREAAFYLIAFCGGLRGEEVPLANLAGILKYWEAGGLAKSPHITITLLGRFKGEMGEQYHKLPLAAVTNSGLKPRLWVVRLLEEYNRLGIYNGPLFQDSNGQPMHASAMEESFFNRLEQIQINRPDLIPQEITVSEEYGISRSFRRGATSEAVNRKVKPSVIKSNNRWRKGERGSGKQVSLDMREHYTDPSMILDHFLIFSQSL